MKLRLSHEKGVEVLSASGPIVGHETKILRAGLSKILKTGKNKIILELPESPDLSSEVIREIAAFDVLARELSGRIVLSGVSKALREKIEAFAKPPVILSFESKDKALAFLVAPVQPEITAAPAAPAVSSEELESLKSEDRLLRSHVRALEQENRELKEQVVSATLARRPPANEAEYIEKISFLESKLERALLDAAAAPAAPAKK